MAGFLILSQKCSERLRGAPMSRHSCWLHRRQNQGRASERTQIYACGWQNAGPGSVASLNRGTSLSGSWYEPIA